MIKAIIIDDEPLCRKTLSIQLAKYCPDVMLMAQCGSANEGLTAIQTYAPDVVFLDVEMPVMNGFDMLEELESIPFAIIFTTGYDAYAIRAIRFSALDFLLKPIDKDDLQRAIARINRHPELPTVESITSDQLRLDQLDILLKKLGAKPAPLQKIALPTLHGFELVPLDTIIQCEADNNYTQIHLKNSKKLLVSRTLKEIEDLLDGHSFLRVHQSHVVNLNEIVRYVRGRGGYVIMSDNSAVNVALSRKDDLLKIFLT